MPGYDDGVEDGHGPSQTVGHDYRNEPGNESRISPGYWFRFSPRSGHGYRSGPRSGSSESFGQNLSPGFMHGNEQGLDLSYDLGISVRAMRCKSHTSLPLDRRR